MITLTDVSVSIHNKPILKNISCTIYPQDFVVLIGTNGAGKSTFFDILTGKTKPDSGTILFDNQDITLLDEKERALFIARLFQNPRLNGISSMTIEQNLALSLYKGRNATLKPGMHCLKELPNLKQLFNIELQDNFFKTPMHSLSGGQRQLLAFIMATNAIPPQLLLLDEPTAALDPLAATNLLKYAIKYIQLHTITTILITHDPQLALTLGNKIWILQDGQLVKEYTQKEKKDLSFSDLIGTIDYEILTT